MQTDRNKIAERVLHLTREIILQFSGEDYTVVKKTSSNGCRAPVCDGWGRPPSPIMGPPPHPLIHEDINVQKILELTNRMIELLTGEVPIRCQDVAVYFSMEEWEYLEGHKDLYKEAMMETRQPLPSPVPSSKRSPPERCPRPLLPQDHQMSSPCVMRPVEMAGLPLTRDITCCLDLLPVFWRWRLLVGIRSQQGIFRSQVVCGSDFYNVGSRMMEDKNKMVERILNLTLEIIFQLTGEMMSLGR
ncbi:uncharacterized protein [Eleutherodactylus coqui]|uniref:uncharacterized protein n=1 Tax=Eleutherodactylus coqui TaxID=57060 RepID=UPI003462562D